MKMTKKWLRALAAGVLGAALSLAAPCTAGLPGTVAEAASETKIPSNAIIYNGHSYYFYDSSKTWSRAEAFCEKRGGHLVTIETKGELSFLKKQIKKRDKNWYWIGLKKNSSTGKWRWVNGNKLTVTNWGTGEPSGDADGCVMMLAKDYSGMDGMSYPSGKWNDAMNGGNTGFWALSEGGFLCEWDTVTPGITNSDGTQITKLTMSLDSTATLTTVGTSGTVKWSSSDKTIASVTSKGVVKAVMPGTVTITAKVNGKSYKCKVTVKNNNASAKSLKFVTTDGGSFVQGAATAKVSFYLNKTAANVTVSVVNGSGTAVYTKTYSKCTANKTCSFTWNGKKNGTGSYAAAGNYKVKVTAGTKTTTSSALTLKKQEFAGGTGSSSNPFQVKTFAQLKKVEKYNGAYFKQTANIDAGAESYAGMFSESDPFTGTYDGNGKTISNLFLVDSADNEAALFNWIGKTGTVKNLKLNSVYSNGFNNAAVLALVNNGKISSCTLTNCAANASVTGSMNTTDDACAAVLCLKNDADGTITGCTVSGGSASAYRCDNWWGNTARSAGLVGWNYGKVLNSTVKNVQCSAARDYHAVYTAGIVNRNEGNVMNCTAQSVTLLAPNSTNCSGGVCAANTGYISGCSFTGTGAGSDSVYENSGTYM